MSDMSKEALSVAFGLVVVGLMVATTTLSWPNNLSEGRAFLTGVGVVAAIVGFGTITVVSVRHWMDR